MGIAELRSNPMRNWPWPRGPIATGSLQNIDSRQVRQTRLVPDERKIRQSSIPRASRRRSHTPGSERMLPIRCRLLSSDCGAEGRGFRKALGRIFSTKDGWHPFGALPWPLRGEGLRDGAFTFARMDRTMPSSFPPLDLGGCCCQSLSRPWLNKGTRHELLLSCGPTCRRAVQVLRQGTLQRLRG